MAYNDKIAYEETVAECLVELFGKKAEDGVGTEDSELNSGDGSAAGDGSGDGSGEGGQDIGSMTQTELIQKAVEAFENAEEAQRDGDWAEYGEYLDELEKYLNQLAS